VPGATVAVISGRQEIAAAVTRDDGSFEFDTVPEGEYSVEVRKPGFRMTTRTVGGGDAEKELNMVLDIGEVSETVDVMGHVRAIVVPDASGPKRVRVGGDVQGVRLMKGVQPIYPAELQSQGVEGAVLIRAVISTDGKLASATVMNSAVNAELAKAALDAVKQWQYAPTLLNGAPVEVVTTITVNFRLPR
jgi:TonB family protein